MDPDVQIALIAAILGPGGLFVLWLNRRKKTEGDGESVVEGPISKKEVAAVDAAQSLGIIDAYSRMANSRIDQLQVDLDTERDARKRLEMEVRQERRRSTRLEADLGNERSARERLEHEVSRIAALLKSAGQSVLSWIDEGAAEPAPLHDIERLRDGLERL